MTAALYKNMDDQIISLEQLEESCCEAVSTLVGALLILRTFIKDSDNDDLVYLCDALKVLLDNAKRHIEDIRPAPLFVMPD